MKSFVLIVLLGLLFVSCEKKTEILDSGFIPKTFYQYADSIYVVTAGEHIYHFCTLTNSKKDTVQCIEGYTLVQNQNGFTVILPKPIPLIDVTEFDYKEIGKAVVNLPGISLNVSVREFQLYQ